MLKSSGLELEKFWDCPWDWSPSWLLWFLSIAPIIPFLHISESWRDHSPRTPPTLPTMSLTSLLSLGWAETVKCYSHTWPAQGPRALKALNLSPTPCTVLRFPATAAVLQNQDWSPPSRTGPCLYCTVHCSLPPSLTDSSLTGGKSLMINFSHYFW